MAIQFVLPMIASVIQGVLAQGLNANQQTRQRNEDIRISALRRQELQPIIDRLQQAQDYFGVEEQLVRDFSRASDQMAAQSAQSGMTNAGSGGLDQVRGDLLGSMLASLAQAKAQDDLQRQAMVAELLSDPTLYDGSRTPGNVGANTIFGGLLGGVAGGATQLSSYLSTPEGIAILQGLGGVPRNPVNSNLPTTDAFGNVMPTSSNQIRPLGNPGASALLPSAVSLTSPASARVLPNHSTGFGSWYLPFTSGGGIPQALTR